MHLVGPPKAATPIACPRSWPPAAPARPAAGRALALTPGRSELSRRRAGVVVAARSSPTVAGLHALGHAFMIARTNRDVQAVALGRPHTRSASFAASRSGKDGSNDRSIIAVKLSCARTACPVCRRRWPPGEFGFGSSVSVLWRYVLASPSTTLTIQLLTASLSRVPPPCSLSFKTSACRRRAEQRLRSRKAPNGPTGVAPSPAPRFGRLPGAKHGRVHQVDPAALSQLQCSARSLEGSRWCSPWVQMAPSRAVATCASRPSITDTTASASAVASSDQGARPVPTCLAGAGFATVALCQPAVGSSRVRFPARTSSPARSAQRAIGSLIPVPSMATTGLEESATPAPYSEPAATVARSRGRVAKPFSDPPLLARSSQTPAVVSPRHQTQLPAAF